MSRNRTIQYAIDLETVLIFSRVDNIVAVPVLDFGHMKPENSYEIVYNLEKISVYELSGAALKWTRKIPVEIKNQHRVFWGMKPLKNTTRGKK